MTARTARAVLGGAFTIFFLGCTNALVFTTATLTGIDINAVEGGQQRITVGYKRSEGVVMPVREKKNTPARGEAFSVLSAMRYDTGSLLIPNMSGTHVKSVFATGRAAEQANVPKAIANVFKAFAGDLFSPEAAFLTKEIYETLAALTDPKQTSAINAVWARFIHGAPDARRYTTFLLREQGTDEEVGEMLQAAKHALAGGAGDPPDLTEAEKKEPRAELVKLMNQNAGNAAELTKILDAVGPKLPGPDEISSATPRELVMGLVALAAKRGDVEELRNVLSAVIDVART